ncbi:ST6GALNAC2 [Branchiostoma lanceolatum]|uniref:alpha-N-acetylgalactosaminide alpha-2,6-sialyltransferase n=1 Tax=Branchiostoma lanceolatum TaxID=7740 RepID=A0A8K0ESA9_BRALA|nr:ST6GALNAC2 [Branchiostoma lanceolatum]
MWSEHINPEEYDRLKLFDRLFGWKNIPYGDVKNCLRHFNTSDHRYMFPGWTPDHAGCVRCAVVGNGGILRGSGKGREIDGHDFVWRVNAAITEGFEDDVGKRTSFYFHCHNSLKNSLKTSRKYGFTHPPQDKSTVYISVAKNVQDYAYFDAAISWKPVKNKSSPPLEYGERPANTKFRMLHPDFIRYLTYKQLQRAWHRAPGRVSAGGVSALPRPTSTTLEEAPGPPGERAGPVWCGAGPGAAGVERAAEQRGRPGRVSPRRRGQSPVAPEAYPVADLRRADGEVFPAYEREGYRQGERSGRAGKGRRGFLLRGGLPTSAGPWPAARSGVATGSASVAGPFRIGARRLAGPGRGGTEKVRCEGTFLTSAGPTPAARAGVATGSASVSGPFRIGARRLAGPGRGGTEKVRCEGTFLTSAGPTPAARAGVATGSASVAGPFCIGARRIAGPGRGGTEKVRCEGTFLTSAGPTPAARAGVATGSASVAGSFRIGARRLAGPGRGGTEKVRCEGTFLTSAGPTPAARAGVATGSASVAGPFCIGARRLAGPGRGGTEKVRCEGTFLTSAGPTPAARAGVATGSASVAGPFRIGARRLAGPGRGGTEKVRCEGTFLTSAGPTPAARAGVATGSASVAGPFRIGARRIAGPGRGGTEKVRCEGTFLTSVGPRPAARAGVATGSASVAGPFRIGARRFAGPGRGGTEKVRCEGTFLTSAGPRPAARAGVVTGSASVAGPFRIGARRLAGPGRGGTEKVRCEGTFLTSAGPRPAARAGVATGSASVAGPFRIGARRLAGPGRGAIRRGKLSTDPSELHCSHGLRSDLSKRGCSGIDGEQSHTLSPVDLLPRRPGCHSPRGQPEVATGLEGVRSSAPAGEDGRADGRPEPAPGQALRGGQSGSRCSRRASGRPNGDGSPLPSACEYALRTRRFETRPSALPADASGRESAGPFLTGRFGRLREATVRCGREFCAQAPEGSRPSPRRVPTSRQRRTRRRSALRSSGTVWQRRQCGSSRAAPRPRRSSPGGDRSFAATASSLPG